MKKEIKLLSDFNFELFYNYLNNKIDSKKYVVKKPSYELFPSACYKLINTPKKSHIIIIWNRIEAIIKEFSKLLNNEKISKLKLNKEVDEYINLILELSKKTDHLIITSWDAPHLHTGSYLKDFTNENGISRNLALINLRIADKLKKNSNIYFFNIAFLTQKNFHPYNPKLWYATKTPYNNQVFELASEEFNEIIKSFSQSPKKLIILDLDNTLWGGIIGEIGWKKINLGGHNHIGEAFTDFQKKIKSLKNKGIQLAIISKNNEKVALEAFQKNKEMVLKLNDFASWRINWDDKAKNLLEITKELNLSNDSCVFIDDNINERNRIKTAIPEVFVPNWPEDPSLYVEELLKLNCFNTTNITKEDVMRTKFYHDEQKRDKIKRNFISHEKWLKSLKIKINCESVNNSNKMRVLQLINKTNQMNLTTRRRTELQLDEMLKDKEIQFKSFRMSDKLGDMGIIGIYAIKYKKKELEVLDFILSCRAFGRQIENYMIYKIIEAAKKIKLKKIIFKYLKTNKNKPCLTFLKSLQLQKKGVNTFIYDKGININKPKHLN